jgi:predicted ATP-dependent serine protease
MQWFEKAVHRFVASGIYLLGGQPGARKSGLALQLALDLARQDQPSLFILNEEPAGRLRERALMLTSKWPAAAVRRAFRNLRVEVDLYDLESLPPFVAHQVLSPAGAHHGIKLLVLDSIQGRGLPAGATTKYRKLYEAVRLCQAGGVTSLLVSHVTKRDQVCGPRDLEHNVDAVLLLRRAMGYRPLFVPKNRFGPALFQPLPLELDPQTTRLRVSPHRRSATTVARTYLGAGAGAAEVQAAVSLPAFGTRGRVIASGVPRREIEQLVACIGQVPGLEVDGLEYAVHCRMPAGQSYHAAVGLPLAMALVGSYLQRPIPASHLYLGEVDLCRCARDLPPPLVDELLAAARQGELGRHVRVFCPPAAAAQLAAGAGAVGAAGLEAVPCAGLDEAIARTWGDLPRGGVDPGDHARSRP